MPAATSSARRATPDRRSGHAIANAVDVGGFALKDGRRISVLRDWNAPRSARCSDFLQTIRASACKRFGTVLSPDYNAAHRNHLHLEDDRRAVLPLASTCACTGICR